MVKIEKTITVDGEDALVLFNLCKVFRVARQEHSKTMNGNPGCREAPMLAWSAEELAAMGQFVDKVFGGD